MTERWLKLFPGTKRSKADFLLDGEAVYGSILRDIDKAESDGHYIYVLGWTIDVGFQLTKDDPTTLFQRLSLAASKGVEIRILVWDNPLPGYRRMSVDAVQRLNRLPKTRVFIDGHTFSPPKSAQLIKTIPAYVGQLIRRVSHSLEGIFYVLLAFYSPQSVGAHHDKVTIVKGRDGLIAYCGGLDFNRNRVLTSINKRERRFPSYHDVACRVQGPAAYEILQKFRLRWQNHPQARTESLLGEKEVEPKPAVDPYPYVKVVGTFNSPDGKQRTRSLQDAYLKIIDAAQDYIYIEDQYLVNLDVAARLNAKIKQPSFQKLIFVIQDTSETISDLLIPNRKRGEFLTAVLNGASAAEKGKVLLTLLDKSHWEQEQYHPGMHAKTLIVDDEIAIIGSANLNQRSFTCDSETCVVVFDEQVKRDQNFARVFRIVTWKEYSRKPVPKTTIESWVAFANALSQPSSDFAKITRYVKNSEEDWDVKVKEAIRKSGVVGVVAAGYLSDEDLLKTTQMLSPYAVVHAFDLFWEHIIDPKVD